MVSSPEPKRADVADWLSKLSTPLLSGAMALIAALWAAVSASLAPEGVEWSLPARVVLPAIGLVFLGLLYLGLLCLQLWLRSRKYVRFCILWDGRGNPLCSKCDGPLSPKIYYFHCPVCDCSYNPYDDDAKMMFPHEAMLISRRKWKELAKFRADQKAQLKKKQQQTAG